VGLPDPVTTPAHVLSGATAVVGGGEWTSAVVVKDGSTWTWPSSGIYADPHTDGTPEIVPGLPPSVVSTTGTGITGSALLADGSVYSWGSNYDGELGDGGNSRERSYYYGQTVFRAAVDGATQLSAGQGHVLARLSDGSLAAWGANWSGQIGNGQVDYSQGVFSPVRVPAFGPSGSVLVADAGACRGGAAGSAAPAGPTAASAAATAARTAQKPRYDASMRVQPRWRTLAARAGSFAHVVRRAVHAHLSVPVVTPVRAPARGRGGKPVVIPFHTADAIVSR
jgi:hypothetical protein